ncbi:MAG: glutamate--cysteine ligase, partial [Pseudonocardiales bacterium]|nr:glutamate--cysteine ligase [Pseudonocardiales bacterium]
RGEKSWDAPVGVSFADWVAGALPEPPTTADLDLHLSTMFPPVRPHGHLEVRYLDAQDGSRWVTPFTLLAALMARPSTIDQVLGLTEASAGRWLEAARDGLADPVLRATARDVVQLGADSLDHLDLTVSQLRVVLDDLASRVETFPSSQRCSA